MNKEQLSNAIGKVDESLIAEATGYEKKTTGRRFKWYSVAAAAALVVALVGAFAIAAPGVVAKVLGLKPNVDTTTVDPEDSKWEEVISDAPYVNEMMYTSWDNPVYLETTQIRALAETIDEEEGFLDAGYASIADMENAFGIDVLELGKDPRNVSGLINIISPEHGLDGGVSVSGSWLAEADDINTFISYSLVTDNTHLPTGSIGTPITENDDTGSYEIKSLGVTAQLVSSLVDSDRQVSAYFIYENIAYHIVATDSRVPAQIDIPWLCEQLEGLHK